MRVVCVELPRDCEGGDEHQNKERNVCQQAGSGNGRIDPGSRGGNPVVNVLLSYNLSKVKSKYGPQVESAMNGDWAQVSCDM